MQWWYDCYDHVPKGGVQNDYHKHFNDRGVLVMVRWGPVRWPTDALKRGYEG